MLSCAIRFVSFFPPFRRRVFHGGVFIILYFFRTVKHSVPHKINAEEFYREERGNDFFPINFIYLHPLRGSREKDVKKFISQGQLWGNIEDSEDWILHSSDQCGNNARMKLMGEQIRQFFGYTPESLEEFSFLSQISQAEANKFYIELFRCNKPVKTGLIWWNLIDGWPQFSDAVVDWYFEKKIAYYYIKRVQQPVCVMLSEMENWHHRVVIANDTLKEVTVKYRVTDADTKDVLAEGSAVICANGIQNADSIRLYYSDKKMLLIDYEVDGVKHKNHYLCGLPPFSPEHYRKWYGMLEID